MDLINELPEWVIHPQTDLALLKSAATKLVAYLEGYYTTGSQSSVMQHPRYPYLCHMTGAWFLYRGKYPSLHLTTPEQTTLHSVLRSTVRAYCADPYDNSLENALLLKTGKCLDYTLLGRQSEVRGAAQLCVSNGSRIF